MLFRTHFVFALLVCFVFLRYLETSFLERIIFCVALLFATAFVDIDSQKSKFGNYWILRPVQWVFSHRGMIHSFLFASILGLAVFAFSREAGIGFFMGYVLHLFLDMFTPEGVSIFWPLFSKRISLVGIRSGGIIEQIFFVLILLLDIYLVWFLFLH
jgi:inner membrane protein